MQEELYYSIYAFDENNCNYTMLFSSKNIYTIIDYYNYFIKTMPNRFIKVCRDIQINDGALC